MCMKDLHSKAFDDQDGFCTGGQSRTHEVIEDQCVGGVLLLELYPETHIEHDEDGITANAQPVQHNRYPSIKKLKSKISSLNTIQQTNNNQININKA